MNVESDRQKDYKRRFALARQIRRDIEDELRECYKFLFEGRQRDFTGYTRARHEPEEVGDLMTEMPAELNDDFATDVCDFYCPETSNWVEYMIASEVPEEIVNDVKAAADKRAEDIFQAIQESNYNSVIHSAAKEAGHGTMALWIERSILGEPIYCEPVPATELYVNMGPRGLDDRFRMKRVQCTSLKALFPRVTSFPDKVQKKIDGKTGVVDVVWGFWIDWDDPRNPQWVMHCTADGEEIPGESRILGPYLGGCPLIVGRVNPDPSHPWGRGPMRKGLPAARTLDELCAMIFENLDKQIDPATFYSSDGMIDLSKGIRSGKAYAVMGNPRDMIYQPDFSGNFDTSFFEKAQLEDQLRMVFFQDGPRQRGDTPPTATQFMQELQRTQRRIGRPTSTLWSEFFAHVIHRFEFLEARDGRIDELLMVGEQVLKPVPLSPLVKAQRQGDFSTAMAILEMASGHFQQQAQIEIDGAETIKRAQARLGDTIVAVRTEEQKQALIQQMAAMQGMAGGGGGGPA